MSLLVVVLSTLGTLLGCILAVNQILRGMRKKWAQDAEQTKAVLDNTAAVKELTAQFAGLNARVDGQDRRLDDHDRRLANGHL